MRSWSPGPSSSGSEYGWVGRTDGYRYDHAFCSAGLAAAISSCEYLHEPRRDRLSGHSALTAGFTLHPEHAQAVELVHAQGHVAEGAGTPRLDDPDGPAETHRDDGTVHLITIRDSRLMLLARQNILGRALQREDMPVVNGTQTGKGHPASVVAVSPAVRRVRLIVLAEGLSQLDATHFQGREKRLQIPGAG
jgi:hypothetical protein